MISLHAAVAVPRRADNMFYLDEDPGAVLETQAGDDATAVYDVVAFVFASLSEAALLDRGMRWSAARLARTYAAFSGSAYAAGVAAARSAEQAARIALGRELIEAVDVHSPYARFVEATADHLQASARISHGVTWSRLRIATTLAC